MLSETATPQGYLTREVEIVVTVLLLAENFLTFQLFIADQVLLNKFLHFLGLHLILILFFSSLRLFNKFFFKQRRKS